MFTEASRVPDRLYVPLHQLSVAAIVLLPADDELMFITHEPGPTPVSEREMLMVKSWEFVCMVAFV